METTGKTVLKDKGLFVACATRQSICGYACCKFTQGNWIMMLEGEKDKAHALGLKMSHLELSEDGLQAVCKYPCKGGDLKPIDCSWYPLFPANESVTKFLVADHRKCPIPNYELIENMFKIQKDALQWEKEFPGTLTKLIDLSRDFVGYLVFPYKIENQKACKMSQEEMDALSVSKQLPEDYVCKQWTITSLAYTATTTPEDTDNNSKPYFRL